jgi:formylglycine-generating enzyme required for sulfatase activity
LGLVVRLPTEVEWECAARPDRNWLYPWGQETGKESPVWANRGDDGPRPLNISENKDVTPTGIHNLAGNLSEWCLDEYQNSLFEDSSAKLSYVPVPFAFQKDVRANPQKPSRTKVPNTIPREMESSRRSFRGGSFKDNQFNCQVSVRRAMFASETSSTIGFRPVLLMRFAR